MFSSADGDSVAKLSERICMWINPQRSRRKTVFCNLWFVTRKKRIMKKTGSRGAGGGSSVMLCKCMCAYNWEPVRVVDGDGRVRSLNRPVTVRELVECHPHHFVCEPTSKAPLYHTAMLPLDMQLEEGRIYLLLPLPRLLPHLSNIFNSEPPSCPCFQSLHPQLAAAAASSCFITPQAAAAAQALVLSPSKTKEAAGSLIHAAAAGTSQDDIPDPDPSKIGICSIDKTMTTSSNSAAGAQLRATTRISEWFNASKSNVAGSDIQGRKNHLRLQAARSSTEQTSDDDHPLGAQQQQQQQEAAKQAGCFMSPMLMASLVHLVKKLLSSLIIPFSTNVQDPGRVPELKVAAAAGFHQCSMRNRWRPALECISELDSQFAAAAGMMLSNEPHCIITAPSRSLCWGSNFCFFERDHRTWTLGHMYGDISSNCKFINHHIILT